jgi:hypothetical protein
MSKRRAFACQEYGHHLYPCAETIFHESSTKRTVWFLAMLLMTSTRQGVAAKEIECKTDDLSGANLEWIVADNVDKGSVVSTDDWPDIIASANLGSAMVAPITLKMNG